MLKWAQKMSFPIWKEKEYQLRTVKCLKISRYFASVVASSFRYVS